MSQTTPKNTGQDDKKQALGNQVNHFRAQHWLLKRWIYGVLGALAILTSIFLLIIHILITWSAVATHGRAIILSKLPAPLASVSIIFMIGVLLIIILTIHWSDGVTLHENGMILRQGIRKRIWLWEDTKRIDTRVVYVKFAGATVAVRIKIILESVDDHRLIIRNHYHQMEELVNQIRVNILPTLYKKEYQRLVQGGFIGFHKNLKANNSGLIINDDIVPWHHIEKLRIDNRKLKIFPTSNPDNPLFTSTLNKITNLDLLLYFVKNQPTSVDQSSPR